MSSACVGVIAPVLYDTITNIMDTSSHTQGLREKESDSLAKAEARECPECASPQRGWRERREDASASVRDHRERARERMR